MNLVLTLGAMIVGCVIGAAGGWSLRRAASRWCRHCGQAIGTTCIECLDRHRAANLRAGRNQRSERLADAA